VFDYAANDAADDRTANNTTASANQTTNYCAAKRSAKNAGLGRAIFNGGSNHTAGYHNNGKEFCKHASPGNQFHLSHFTNSPFL
jgi:hypothetical protein